MREPDGRCSFSEVRGQVQCACGYRPAGGSGYQFGEWPERCKTAGPIALSKVSNMVGTTREEKQAHHRGAL